MLATQEDRDGSFEYSAPKLLRKKRGLRKPSLIGVRQGATARRNSSHENMQSRGPKGEV
jgi:hypothetical protein